MSQYLHSLHQNIENLSFLQIDSDNKLITTKIKKKDKTP
ncbi:hypothetical protein AsAng_0056250 [Aureispira anguillae]|uniref:Uncharacterized protein n=1 Tax=Aureispira anguillae TaxID=2864201 RepID=A0A915YKN0_9BACT|nr:hypothetical protein AsAng_0056250 [Aureispira anguillae]